MSHFTYSKQGNRYTQDNAVRGFIKDHSYIILFVAAAVTMLISIADWSKL